MRVRIVACLEIGANVFTEDLKLLVELVGFEFFLCFFASNDRFFFFVVEKAVCVCCVVLCCVVLCCASVEATSMKIDLHTRSATHRRHSSLTLHSLQSRQQRLLMRPSSLPLDCRKNCLAPWTAWICRRLPFASVVAQVLAAVRVALVAAFVVAAIFWCRTLSAHVDDNAVSYEPRA